MNAKAMSLSDDILESSMHEVLHGGKDQGKCMFSYLLSFSVINH